MSRTTSQRETFLRLLAGARAHARTDLNLPSRIQQALAAQRSFGSRDRRLYRELLYTALRYLPWIEPLLDTDPALAAKTVAWLAADTRATSALRAELTADWPPVPASLAERAAFLQRDPAALLPEWFRAQCPRAFEPGELDTLHRRAPLWLRLQTAYPTEIHEEFTGQGWTLRASRVLPEAFELVGQDADITKTHAYENGLVEIQDLGSQLLLAHAAIAPGEHWLDACAGAGGKTLQLATLLAPNIGSAPHAAPTAAGDHARRAGEPPRSTAPAKPGQVDAHDIRPAALEELKLRAARARLRNVHVLPRVPAGTYDGVLVDAPCSGSGTWRRAPHLKWASSPALIADRAALQKKLLAKFALNVRPGGRLIYATCSLCRDENEGVVEAFAAANSAFALQTMRTIFPSEHDTDGFFTATFTREP